MKYLVLVWVPDGCGDPDNWWHVAWWGNNRREALRELARADGPVVKLVEVGIVKELVY